MLHTHILHHKRYDTFYHFGVIVLLLTSLSGVFSSAMASQAFFKQGVVAARSLVLGPDGQPIFAEFGKDGEVVNVIGEATGELLDATVMFGDAYRLQAKSFNDFKKANEKGSARGAKILTREEYETTEFGSVDVPTNRKDAQGNFIPESKPIRKPSLRQDTLSVYVRDKKTILFPEDGPILLESRIDLRNLKDLGPIVLEDKRGGDYVLSVLLNSEGRVLETSTVNIGYRSAFFSSENRATALSDTDKDRQVSREKDDIVLGPLAGVHVYSSLVRRQVGIADEEGQYSLSYLSPPCPGFTFEYRHNLIAEIPYKSFNPKSSQPWRKYSANLEVFDICNGLGQGAPATTLAGLSAQQSSAAIVATQAVPLLNADIKVDVILLTGEGLLSNSADESDVVPLGDSTQYNVDLPDFDLINPAELDLNGDRQPDRLKKLSENTIGVFFPDNTPGPGGQETPDLVRRTDIEPDLQDQSLLETLNIDDLEDTDLYVYRLSNDQLITQREGLKQEEYVPYNNIGVSDDENKFFYKLLIRGTRQRGFITGQLEDFQEKTQINEKLIGRDVDFLRVGEQVKIIAINRITGYIGTTVTQVEGSANGNLNFPIKKLVLRPPNLKIKAERTYTVEAGLTKDEERKYLIGAEGSALTSDTTVVISSQWFDQDGSPLPSNLPGYTGRLAKVVGANSLQAVGGDVAMFDILPGNKLQLVRLSEGDIGREHFYVQVSGEPMDGNPDFSTLGAGAGPQLEYRPQHYVPIKVALLDEVQTRKRRNELFYAQQDALTELEKVDAVYKWVYRPEMQFSVFDLNVKDVKITDADDKTRREFTTSNIYLDGSDKSLDINYDLQADSDGPPLDGFGPARELLLAVGGDEQLATTETGQTLSFTNLPHLADLASSDLVSVRLYQNSDSFNILWEFALSYSELTADFNRDGKIIAANELFDEDNKRTDAVTKEKPFVFWLNDDDDDLDSETKGFDIDASRSFALGFGNDPDYENEVIDGSRDLIDFFPVSLNLYRFIRNIDPKMEYSYRLKQSGEAVNIVYTEMDRDKTNVYLKNLDPQTLQTRDTNEPVFATWESATELKEVLTHKVRFRGLELPTEFLDLMKKDEKKGVFLVEARLPSKEPLVLEVKNTDGDIVIRTKMALNLVKARDMYQHISFRNNNEDSTSSLWGASPTPPNIDAVTSELASQKSSLVAPDTLDEDRRVIFLHGFNVTKEEAIGTQNEVFKRLHQSGSNTLFTGVSWNGTGGFLDFDSLGRFNYWGNVENAFYTADDLAALVNNLSGSKKVIIGHSLGNMVISSAIQDFGMNVAQYFMLNPSVAVEAYDATQLSPVKMRHLDWDPFYDTQYDTSTTGRFGAPKGRHLWSTEWHSLFMDNRKNLTWRDRFTKVTTYPGVVQYYSTADEVLSKALERVPQLPDLSIGISANVWSIQEKAKGRQNLAGRLVPGVTSGGWGFRKLPLSECIPILIFRSCTTDEQILPNDAFAISNEGLKVLPFFKPFVSDALLTDAGSAAVVENFPYIMGYEIPALSFAAGSTRLNPFTVENAINMNGIAVGWPFEERNITDMSIKWLHSDFKDVAYLYTHKLYKDMVDKGVMR